MNKKQIVTLSVALAFGSIGAANAQRYFNSFDGQSAPSAGTQLLLPSKYKIVSADNGGLQTYLHALKSDPGGNQTIQLPTPDGSVRTFKIWKSSMMEDGLQAKFPGIETFTAVAEDNAQVTAKLDYTLNGFHAMIFDGNNTFLVDPYTNVNDGYYLVYYKNDYQRSASNFMPCGFTGEKLSANGSLPSTTGGGSNAANKPSSGTQKKVYRLALSCTGEYAAAVITNPNNIQPLTKAGVLSAMTTTMNRVNGIYEREFSVTMVLITNEDNLIYLSASTDPFDANNDGNMLLDENQSNTTSVVGSAAYDIGHIFSTGGGGIAEVGSVCNANRKAMGVTGSFQPYGDAYDVDYVAHEMGHQYGAYHTFNSNVGSCLNNGEVEDAFEPGSGTTIMAYAGICSSNAGNDNIQQHSNDYFHAISLDEISDYVTSSFATCGTTTSTGITAPVLSAIADTFYIPIHTPFELTAPTATTGSSDTVTYCWEQRDLGDFGLLENRSDTFTTGPTFRSFDPAVSNKVRVFPQIAWVLSNTFTGVGERMPTVARSMNFGLTTRSIFNGYGGFNITNDRVRVNVVATSGPFVITSPASASDDFMAQSQTTVTWNVANTTAAPVSTANVDILMSIDGGYTFPYTLISNTPNDGSEAVTIPNVNTTLGRIKVKGSGNVFFDISDYNFTTHGAATSAINNVALDNNITVYPNPAKDLINIKNAANTKLTVSMFNVLGQKVYSGSMKQTTSISVDGLSRGVYYLQLINENGDKAVKPVTLQ
jgi:hypothetical protein